MLTAALPGDRGVRQPVHTVYVARRPVRRTHGGRLGLRRPGAALEQHAGPGDRVREGCSICPAELADEVYERVRAKLEREPIEDLRIDFEDGYGNRPDDEEDAAAIAAAQALAEPRRPAGPPSTASG